MIKIDNHNYTGANWNDDEDGFTQLYSSQLQSQFWLPEDISLQPDLNLWYTLPEDVKTAYARNLLVLTFLDTHQGNEGNLYIGNALDENEHQRKATMNYIAMTENAIHAKSYSTIFMSYMHTREINELFEWGNNNKNLQNIMNLIVGQYKKLDLFTAARNHNLDIEGYSEHQFQVEKWKAMVASVFLETWLFYSGFYYPLWFYGQGKLMQAGEIINLILRDESVHGLYIGRLAQEVFETFDKDTQTELETWMHKFLDTLYVEQSKLVEEMYGPVGLIHDVKVFVRYNANKALMNLGFETKFPQEEVNPVVLNGLNTESKTFDFFSMKGNSYQKITVEALDDDDFNFE